MAARPNATRVSGQTVQPRPRAWDRSAQPDKSLVPGSTPDTHRRHRIGPDGTGRRQSTCSRRRHRGSSSGLPHQVSARRQPGPVCGRWSGTRRCDDGRLTARIPGQTAQRRPRRWCAESSGAASIAGIQAEFRSTSRPTAAPSARSRTRCAGAKAVRFDAHGGVIVSVLRPGVCFAGAAKGVLANRLTDPDLTTSATDVHILVCTVGPPTTPRTSLTYKESTES